MTNHKRAAGRDKALCSMVVTPSNLTDTLRQDWKDVNCSLCFAVRDRNNKLSENVIFSKPDMEKFRAYMKERSKDLK